LELPTHYAPSQSQLESTSELFPTALPKVDFFTLHNVRAHGKGKKKKPAAAAFSFDDKKEEEGTAEGGEEGAGDGAGGSGGGASGGAGGDDGKGGGDDKGEDDWDDWGSKKNKKKSKKKQDEEEEEEKPKEEKDDWAGVGGEDEWGGWSAKGGKKKTEKKTEDDPAASTSAWADNAGGGAEDEDWAGFAGGKKKKNKKKLADEPAKPDDSFHEIQLDDDGDLGAPKISLSFDEPAPAKKEEPASSGFGFGGWGSSWSFGGLAGKKDEDKDKNGEKSPGSGGFWGKSSLSDFNFGFGANTDGKSLDIGDSKKQADDEDDFLPAWGGGASSTKKGASDKKPKFGIEEVDDPPAASKAGDDTWGGWGKKPTTSTKKDTASTDSWSGSGSGPGSGWGSTATKKDKPKSSWADIMEEEDDTTALPAIGDEKKTEDSWGMWGTKTGKDSKKTDDDVWGGFDKKKDSKPAIEEVKEEDLSVLKGLTCSKDGKILDNSGTQIGELYEGDATIIARRLYLCSEKGEFKDKKFKVIGKARLLPKEDPPVVEEALVEEASAGTDDADAPPLSALEGLCCERDGTIKDYGGKVIGKVIDGDPAEFASKMFFCDSNGNVCDYKNKPVGKCKTIGADKPKKEKAKDDDIWGWAATSKASSKVPPPPKGPAKADKKDDTWGSWGAKKDTEEEKPAEEPAASSSDLPPLSILQDRTVDADGKVYNDDNVPIGECVDGDIATIARRKYKIDGEGNVMSRLGKVLGKCIVLPSQKKEEALLEPEPEPVIEEVMEEAPVAEPPPLSALKGRTIEEDGTILNADGDVIGEVTEGDAARFASIAAKCDGNGNILNSKKKAVGKCKTVAPQSTPVTEAPSEAPAEEEAPPPPEPAKPSVSLADLMGRKIESNGDVLDDDLNVIAKVIEGNAKQMAKKGGICDAEGNIVLGKKTLGKVELLEPEVPEEVAAPEPPPAEEEAPTSEEPKAVTSSLTLASLEGRFVEADGSVFDDNGVLIGRVIDGKPKQMAKKKATCDANGNVVFGFSMLGTVELVLPEGATGEEPEPEAEAPPPPPPVEEEPPQAAEAPAPTLAILEGRMIEKNGDILNNEGELVGRLVTGSASKLYKGGAKCDADGNVIMKSKIQKDATVELVLPEKVEEEPPIVVEEEPAAPEPSAEEANPFAKLEGLKIEKNGDVLDGSGELVALLVAGSASKLYKAGASLDAEGKIWAKGKEVKDAKVEMIEPEKKEEDPIVEEPPPVEEPPAPEESPYAKLDGRKMEKNGDILDGDGNVLATVIGGSLSKMYKAGATCDAEGKIWAKGKEVKDATIELVQPPEPEDPLPAGEPPVEEPPVEEPPAPEPVKPSFASIDGKMLDKFGEIYNDDNVLVARLVEGSAGTLYKKGAYCDADGNVIINGKKQKTAKLELVVLEDPPEPPAEPEPEAEAPPPPVEEEAHPAESSGRTVDWLEGFAVDISGDIFDDEGNVVGRLVEGSATKLYNKFALCGPGGTVVVNGKAVKGARVELVESDKSADPEPEAAPEELPPPPPPAPKELTLADLDGRGFDEDGNVLNDHGVVIGKLVGEMKKLKLLLKAKATCGSDGSVYAKGVKVPKVSVDLVQPDPPAAPEPEAEPEPEPEAPAEPEPEPEAEVPSLAILEGRPIDKSGDIYDLDMNLVGRLAEGDPKKLAKQAATCDADGGVWAKKKRVAGARVELVLPDPPAPPEPEVIEPEPEPEPEAPAEPEPPTLASLDGRTIQDNGDIHDDDGVVIGRIVDGTDKLKLLVKNKATCDADGKVWAKGKQVPRVRVEVVVPTKSAAEESKDAVKDLLDSIDDPDNTWGDPWAATGFSKTDSKKKRVDSVAISPTTDDRALTRFNTTSSKTSKKDDDWDDWTGTKKDKKKSDPKVMQAEAVDEPDADKKDLDTFGFAFTNKRDKKTPKKKGVVEVEDFDTPTQKAETIEEQKSSGQEDSDWAFASNRVKAKKAAAKSTPKSSLKAIEASSALDDEDKPTENVPEDADDDGIVPDDSASVYKEPIAKKKEDKPKTSSMWGGIFGARGGSSSKTPGLSQLRKEREEREKKDREEREKEESQEREEQERIERERIEAEQAEQERIEQEERDKALKEAEKAQKSTKKGKKSLTKSKIEDPLPPPPPPPPAAPPAFDDFEPEADESNDAFAIWGVKRKPVKSANEKSSLKADAKKALEEAGDEVLPIANTKSAVASSSSKTGLKSSSKLKTGSIADRIKALQGETKLRDDSALTPPVPPPPPAAPLEEAKELVPESSSKKSKKLATSSKSASKSSKRAVEPAPEPEPEPEPEPVKKKGGFAIGGFPDTDEEDDLLIDLEDSKPPTPPPEPEMGARGIAKSSKKLGSKSASKSSKTPTKTSKSKPVKKDESGSETEAEPEDKAVTQASGSTTAVDDQQAPEDKLPTPPPEAEKRKSTSPTVKKERAKVVRGSTGNSWGLWGAALATNNVRPKARDSVSSPMATRPRANTRKSVPTDPDRSETEKKTPVKPSVKRASTFSSIFAPAPARRQSTRSTRRPSSRPHSGRASPVMPGVENDDDNDEIPRVSSKAAKLMGINPGAGASRRASTKSKGKTSEITPQKASLHTSPQEPEVDTHPQIGRTKDPYDLGSDDEEPEELQDNGNDIYAVDSPAAPNKNRKSKRKSVAEASASAKEDDPLVEEDPSLDGARALGADTHDPPTSRRHSPSTRRSASRSLPQTAAAVGGIMGLFGLRRSNTTKDTPRSSDPSFAGGRSRGAGYETDAGYRRSSKRSDENDNDSAARRERRERRKSRREPDEGFTTDAAGAQTDYEQAERRRADRREARRAEKERLAELTRESEERDARRKDRDGDKEARRAARRERDEARIAEEVEKRRRAEKEERRAARKAREEDRLRQEGQTRVDEDARAAKEERRAKRRAEREARDPDAERPRGERRKSSYGDGEEKQRSSRRDSRRQSRAVPVDDYFDSRNGGTGTTPYFGGAGGDKTSSWVDSVNREPPAPLQPEDTATVIEPTPEEDEEHDAESEEEVRRRMHGRRERRRERDSGEVREPRDDRDREERRRERKRRDRAQPGEKTDAELERERHRRSSYYPEPNHPYPDYNTGERPQAAKRTSWLKKIPINNLF
jgi:hypothetical protein